MIKKHIIIFVLLISCTKLLSQAGTGVYSFLDLPVSSRLASLGGANVSIRDNDLNFAFQNPSLLTSESNNQIGLNMASYLADIKFGSAMYARNFDQKNYFAVGIQYIDFGTFKETTDLNEILGTFTAKDMALNIIYARWLTKRISVGASLKPIYSAYERYSSFGIAIDAGVSYNDPVNLFSAGLVIKNLGTQLKGYYSDENGQHYEPLPLNIQLGITKKLSHAPFRFSFSLHNLQHWDLNYSTLNETSANSASTSQSDASFIDMAFRHSIIGVEFLPGKNFYIAASYNHRRHQELTMNGFKSMAGFSIGGGVKLYKFQVGFGMSQFQVGNYSYQFSISTSLNEFRL